MKTEFYDLSVRQPNGYLIDFSQFRNKIVLVVNTATRCGLAPQFKDLENLHQKYKDKNLIVLGFPCNQFLGQEPETNEGVEAYCELNFGVTFPLTEKVEVNGKNTHPVFVYLKKSLGGFFGDSIKWNFTKFLIDQNGKPINRYAPTDKPQKIEKDILRLLAK